MNAYPDDVFILDCNTRRADIGCIHKIDLVLVIENKIWWCIIPYDLPT